ncbi:ExeM/NucH family extracellular endonuclease [Georgenia sp. 311]|uniref:ExeM/NucH family extracellular endonuclease n=1 Tax=Georgenia sp. 311 TaxID=2585134 RepID=UPI00111272DC|nr:ExeM/NucH family extracellular endonuclease [Georgenia sp. 311]TNC21367.1 ExeM/NucH family extracellular endonuclease [Georgenia sp. 311]
MRSRGGVAAVGIASLVLSPLLAVAPAAAAPDGSAVVINEVYARGGSANQPYLNKFVELYNPTEEAVPLDGMTLQYRSATGVAATTSVVPLSGMIAPGGYYLVEGASNGTTGQALPTPDVRSTMNPQGSNGVVVLVDGTAPVTLPQGPVATGDLDGAILDLVGTGTATTFETAPAANQGGNSDPLSWQRAEGADTDDNSADFTMAAPTPRNAAGTEAPAPEPEPEPTDPPEMRTIAEIQGTGDTTPLAGQVVATRGVVTGVYPTGGFNGAFIQTPGTGADLEGHTASHGIFVFGGGTAFANTVKVGDHVEVTGAASEYFGLTQLTAQTFTVLDEAAEPVVPAAIELPALAEREPFESMLLAPQGDFTVTDNYNTNRFGWVGLAAGTEPLRQPTDVVAPRTTEYTELVAANADREIRLDDGASHDWTNFSFADHNTPLPYLTTDNPVRVGAPVDFERPVVLDFRRTVANEDATWNLQPQTRLTGDNAADVQPITWPDTRPAAPAEVGGDVTLATFNVLNYFTHLGAEEQPACQGYNDRAGNPTTARNCDVRGAWDAADLARQTEKIVAAVNALDADVVALQEIENSFSFVPGNAPADRDHALAGLVEALNAVAGDGVWGYVASPAAFPAEEDVIRNAFIYRTASVEPVGDTTILIGNDAFANARQPMAQEFALVGEPDADTFVVINNHFKSKGSGSGVNADQGDGQGASNADRVRQAEALAAFADTVAGEAQTDLVFLVGDFNSYTMEDPLEVLYGQDYANVAQELTEKSTYAFGSMVGSLDHVLASPAAFEAVTDADIWNINSYESIAFEYSRHNYNVTDFHDASPYRSSDHDPILVGIDLVEDRPTVDINLLAFNDFHGRLFADVTADGVTTNDTLGFAGTIERLRAEEGEENTVLFSSGDNIGASLFTSSLQEDRPTVEILNALDLLTSAVGNHEFDGGYDNLTGQVSDWADFSHLGANVTFADTGAPALDAYETVEVQGLTVAVIGAVTEETPTLVSPGGIADLEFGDPVEAVNRVAAELTDGNATNGEADVIVAAYHEGAGFENTSTLEEEVATSEIFDRIVNDTSAKVDAIFNGHTHKVYAWDGPVPGVDGESRPVIQGESYGEFVSQVVLTVDAETGDVVDYDHRNVPASTAPVAELVAAYPRVAEVKTILDAALAVADEKGREVVGSVTADITTAYTAAGARDDRAAESTLGNLVADALRETLSEDHRGGAQIGVVNPGGLRAELLYTSTGAEADGEVTFAEANAVLPFLNDLWTVTLSGEQVKQMLEQQWQPDGSSRSFLHLGLSDNVSYTMDPAAPRGERITSVTVDGEPLDLEADYRIGTFSFLAQGGDNFSVFKGATDVQQTGLIDRDAWIGYLREASPLSPDFARRATVVDPLPSQLEPGQAVSFEVSRLDLTSKGSPANTELTVSLVGAGGQRTVLGTAAVTDGAATVGFTVPAGLAGQYSLEMVAAPSGTTIQVPVTVTTPQPQPQPPQYGFFLTNGWEGGSADHAFVYGRWTDEVLIGDWDGDGRDSITVRRGATFHVNNRPAGGPAQSVFTYGRPGDVVLVGDWDGDGTDTLAVRRGNVYHVKNSLTGGKADVELVYGRPGDDVLVGDWDGNGTDTFAVRRGAEYHVKDSLTGGKADTVLVYGRATDEVYAGDWDGDGEDTLAVRRGIVFHVKNSLTGGPADTVMAYGRLGDEVYVGDWDGDGEDTIGLRRTP